MTTRRHFIGLAFASTVSVAIIPLAGCPSTNEQTDFVTAIEAGSVALVTALNQPQYTASIQAACNAAILAIQNKSTTGEIIADLNAIGTIVAAVPIPPQYQVLAAILIAAVNAALTAYGSTQPVASAQSRVAYDNVLVPRIQSKRDLQKAWTDESAKHPELHLKQIQ